jgi:hypothetical protein
MSDWRPVDQTGHWTRGCGQLGSMIIVDEQKFGGFNAFDSPSVQVVTEMQHAARVIGLGFYKCYSLSLRQIHAASKVVFGR